MDILLKPARIATSKPAQRTYLNTLLLTLASTILLGIAVLAYATFYWNYIPRIGIERIVHLQYGDGLHPYGITSLDNELVSQQQYDIALTLHVPRSPRNLEKGNFMVSVHLLRSTYTPPPSSPPNRTPTPLMTLKKDDTITTLRRAAILTYTSRLISLSERLLALPLYLLRLKKEAENLHIPLAELLAFSGRGRGNVPEYAVIEIEGGQEVQIYDARITFVARFGGLRWWMYNHRILSAGVGIGSFWFAEVLFTLVGWLMVRSFFKRASHKSGSKESIKDGEDSSETGIKREAKEEEDHDDDFKFSDTERTFPTYGRNKKPLRWEKDTDRSRSPGKAIKIESQEVDVEDITRLGAVDADDEDEQLGSFMDSGVGTSYSEAGGSGLARRGSGRRRNRSSKDGAADA